MNSPERNVTSTSSVPLDFLWMELTNRCNLQCSHCYSESSPSTVDLNPMSLQQQSAVLADSYQLGCRKVQFIGGEPTLNKNIDRLISISRELGYSLIEVYTNLVHLPDDLLGCFVTHEVNVATSVYSNSATEHDLITRTPGSFRRTIANLRKCTALGVKVRVSIIEMPENAENVDAAEQFLRSDLGIQDIRVDRIRPFGRATHAPNGAMADLCGSCAGHTLCVGPDGLVSPCIMSKRWAIGSLHDESFVELAQSRQLSSVRKEIGDAVRQSRTARRVIAQLSEAERVSMDCAPDNCGPVIGCPPLNQCGPEINRVATGLQCAPDDVGCGPLNQCGPIINAVKTPIRWRERE